MKEQQTAEAHLHFALNYLPTNINREAIYRAMFEMGSAYLLDNVLQEEKIKNDLRLIRMKVLTIPLKQDKKWKR